MNRRKIGCAGLMLFAAGTLEAAPMTFCNPLPLEKIPVGRLCRGPEPGKGQFRELADPALVCENGAISTGKSCSGRDECGII